MHVLSSKQVLQEISHSKQVLLKPYIFEGHFSRHFLECENKRSKKNIYFFLNFLDKQIKNILLIKTIKFNF
jgi:hypothetical protein